jgi:hypothetical protein
MALDCKTVMDSLYEDSCGDEGFSILFRLRRALHLFFCAECTAEAERADIAAHLMREAFMPPSPELSDSIMSLVSAEEIRELSPEQKIVPLRGWIIAGFFLLLAMTSAYFGENYLNIANTTGMSFVLPIGLIMALVVVGYGAVFVATHLEMLNKKFGALNLRTNWFSNWYANWRNSYHGE